MSIIPPTSTAANPSEVLNSASTAGATQSIVLHQGKMYALTCSSSGADPNKDIQFYLMSDCNQASTEFNEYGVATTFNDIDPDCVDQPEVAGEVESETIIADFYTHDGKCLRCESGGEVDEYQLVVRSKLFIKT